MLFAGEKLLVITQKNIRQMFHNQLLNRVMNFFIVIHFECQDLLHKSAHNNSTNVCQM